MTKKSGFYLLLSFWIFNTSTGYSQAPEKRLNKDFETDTSRIYTYNHQLTTRVFMSQKYTRFVIPGTKSAPSLRYNPNSSLDLGIGLTYRAVSVNVGYGFTGLNDFQSERGKTKNLDLQLHLYGRKLTVDLLGQFYKGYYLSIPNFVPGFSGFYTRGDIKVRMIGGSCYYIFNNRKFSYRAGFIQSEWQTRSAGSFLLGGDIYFGAVNSDSLLVPR
ncbi:MAG: DUF4421 family protein, partial [Dyadobacter sp.]